MTPEPTSVPATWPTIDDGSLRRERWDRVRELMVALDLDHLILTSPDTIRYASGVRTHLTPESHQWFAMVIDRDGASDLFVPYVDDVIQDPYPGLPVRSMRPAPAWAPSSLHPRAWATRLIDILSRNGARRVGLEGLTLTLADALTHHEAKIAWHSVEAELHQIRRQKLPDEIRLLEAVSRVNSRAVEAALDAGREGARDYEFLAAAADLQFRSGVEAYSHGVCNVRKESGDWYADGTVLRPGDAFMFDIGCYGVGGYASDIARVGFVDDPPATVASAYRHLLDALRTGEDLAKPGIHASDIHSVVNAYLVRHGCAPTPYAMGHGIGLRLCEPPTIYIPEFLDDDPQLQVGDVIAIEPETSVEIDGRRIVLKVEDNYVVEPGGLRRLSDARY